MKYDAYIYIFQTFICIQMYVYMAAYGHIYSYMHHFGAWKVSKTSSQGIHTQEVGAHYTKLTQLRCSTTQIPCGGL